MIYSKTNASHLYFDRSYFKPLSEVNDYDNEIVYWYDQHDASVRQTPFRECLDDKNWERLKTDPNAKIILFYGDEYYNLIDVTDWCDTIKKYQIPPEKIYIVCLDTNWLKWTVITMATLGVKDVNIQPLNILMNRVELQSSKPVTKRFSALSRNYNRSRLKFYSKLEHFRLLDQFNYTFNNILPYGNVIIVPHSQILKDLKDLEINVTPEIEKWVSGIPYTLPADSVFNKLANEAYNMIQTAGINVIIESHFDPFWNFDDWEHIDVQKFSPAFPTEKTYKPIACRKPFIVFSTPFFLKEFRKLGYKTFSPYIDESYDTIEDDNERLNAIVNEIERLCELPDEEFNDLMLQCTEIANFNADLMIRHKKQVAFIKKFKWLDKYIIDTYNFNKPTLNYKNYE